MLPSCVPRKNFSSRVVIELEAEKRRRECAREAAERAARATRLEVQRDRAREFQRLLDSGEVRNRAELARRLGISRARVTQVMGDLQQIAAAGDVEDHVKAFLKTDAGATADVEISMAQNLAMPLPKWVLCGTHGTLTSDGTKSTLRWFDPATVPPLAAVDGPAAERKYGNADQLPWQEKTIDVPPRAHGVFYDNVAATLAATEPMRVTAQSVREVMRIIALVRKGTAFPGKSQNPEKRPRMHADARG